MNKLEKCVSDFMEIHKLERTPLGSHPSVETRLGRTRYLLEELHELVTAMQKEDPIEEVADALGDLLYVIIGTFITYSIPIDPIFKEIHRSNMTKGKLDKSGKGGKTKSFEPPRLKEVLKCLK